ncbi:MULTISPECIES: YggS family pyridoxal phosphate-dependent enzyme [Vibrio]|jgi:PLP dependent protein|uniref:YggS family pyridoxal phosphate-dependent enzyme n=1 Tax=Vibrio TaxID=662 RepID=UPI000769B9C3|nr:MULTISPECIES: YggS family pyridoxal phosphate-dependent enzyme [Vibrio]MBU2909987.1 YggS family pyridoxal phosphate-dependent enzyme [Vibrio splendidus]MDH5937149.1 YggS family pyridoxal phosphate-dependent enzyme [Vibrio splendidus]MDH5978902.1 YggS family pyridoxal phosphate-dependent enzyme [Vibrio splendidus]MDO6532656.1 YggS family pyridoxal phosphate-dependent enzyme [Vibrio splendidus]MDO6553732.1 YggS family pyridoxal phosphate-dependent enzyme [Vibrio splendidus]
MSSIQQNIEQITSQIRSAEQKCGRAPESVQLLAVSKTKPIGAILEAALGGQVAFGENYVQEGVDKVKHFSEQHSNLKLEWHFIGPIQSNKTRPIAESFQWVHSVERDKIAQRLSAQRPSELPPLQVLIQVNTSGEESKSGTSEETVFALAELISSLPNLTLRGLMSIPANVSDYQSQLNAFSQLAELKDKLTAKYPNIDTLSMGMSGDMDAAVEAGSTMVRIGTAIFGARNYAK